jgi:hypothetical protein
MRNKSPHELDSYALEQVSFEIKFPAAYLHWDQAGRLWKDVSAIWPELELASAEPNKTSFTLNRSTEFWVSLQNAAVIQHHPERRDLAAFAQMCKQFLNVVVERLEIGSISRVGLRQQFFCEFETREVASEQFFPMKLIRIPETAQFGTRGKPIMPEYGIRWEGEILGSTIRVRVDEQRLKFEPNPQFPSLEPIDLRKSGIALDLDYYSTVAFSIGKLDVEEWVRTGTHATRRDVKLYIGA